MQSLVKLNAFLFLNWHLFLIAATIIILSWNTYVVLKIKAVQRTLMPKARLIHFIYQSITTTDLQVTQLIQKLAEINADQNEILSQLEEIKTSFKSKEKIERHIPSSKASNTTYANAIQAIIQGHSLDEIAQKYQLSRDELEILSAVYSPSKRVSKV